MSQDTAALVAALLKYSWDSWTAPPEIREAASALERLEAENAELRRKLNAPDPMGDALNSGDGSYKP